MSLLRERGAVVGILLIAAYAALALAGALHSSMTYDEILHLTAGTAYWRYNDYRLHPENGVLPQRLEALPLVLSGFRFPSGDDPAWVEDEDPEDVWKPSDPVYAIGERYFYRSGNEGERMLLLGRLVVVAMGALLCAFAWAVSSRLFGAAGGLFSLALLALSPTAIANGHLATSDMAVSLALLGAVMACRRWLLRPTPGWTAILGLALGTLFLSKMSAVIVLPVLAGMVAVRGFAGGISRQAGAGPLRLALTAAAALAIALGTVWLGYGLSGSPFSEAIGAAPRFTIPFEELTAGQGARGAVLEWLRGIGLLPEAFVYGHAWVGSQFAGRPAYLDGAYSFGGWWYYLPCTFLLKNPLPFLLLLVSAALLSVRPLLRALGEGPARRREAVASLDRVSPYLLLVVAYGAAACLSGMSIGHRHLLPIYAPLCILAGHGGAVLASSRQGMRSIAAAALALLAAQAVMAAPHFVGYANILAGDKVAASSRLADSSMDWGQELKHLGTWLAAHRAEHGGRTVHLAYFGAADPRALGIRAVMLPSLLDFRGPGEMRAYDPGAGLYCVSVTTLRQLYSLFPAPWAEPQEEAYRRLALRYAGGGGAGVPYLGGYQIFDALRLARLCAYLRHAEPIEVLGNSIVIFDLDEARIAEALSGPPVELIPDSERVFPSPGLLMLTGRP